MAMEVRRRRTKTHDNKLSTRQSAKFDCNETETSGNSTNRIERTEVDQEVTLQKSNKHCSVQEQLEIVNEKKRVRVKINLEIDLIAVVLLIAAIITRLYRLEEPRSIVFDELHYGKHIGLYMKRTFFFDSHPPLGKQLISIAAYIAGFDGHFKFDRIGSPYADTVPLFALRLIPALCGSLIIPTAYHFALELGLKQWSAAIAGMLLLFDNALLIQSRFILMESILIQFSLLGLLCIIKFRKIMDQPKSFLWWLWLSLGIASLTCALCVKYVGFYSLVLALFLIARDYWSLIPRNTLSTMKLLSHLLLRIFIITVVMCSIYLGVFYVHLETLSKAGPHDTAMTSAFQASLEGGLASITKGQPLEITHGSQITLRPTYGRACWLHSHNHMYPLRYPDGRGSSHQQQVTCYSFKDVNNWWIVKRPDRNDLVVTKPSEPIRHGDVIQLVHGMTIRALHSHDVAAPMTPQSQEVSCYIDYNVSMPAQNLWRVEIANKDQSGDTWLTIQSQVRLVHVNTEYALKFSGRQLPDWGFNQHEVVADRLVDQSNSIWNVEEHRYTKNEDQKQRERELINAEMIPLRATTLSFWEKFVELQIKMLFSGQESQSSHMYSSEPLEWPFMSRGIAYWISNDSNAQIYLLGNIAVWYSGTVALTIYIVLMIFYIMRRRRMCFDIANEEWNRFLNTGGILLSGYFLHFLPFIFVERTLFLHHYLPAFVFKVLLTAAVMDHIYYLIRKRYTNSAILYVMKFSTITWLIFIIYVFRKFTALSYGTVPLSAKDLLKLRWKDTWDFIIHRS